MTIFSVSVSVNVNVNVQVVSIKNENYPKKVKNPKLIRIFFLRITESLLYEYVYMLYHAIIFRDKGTILAHARPFCRIPTPKHVTNQTYKWFF